MTRRLTADEKTLWAMVAATVKPLHAPAQTDEKTAAVAVSAPEKTVDRSGVGARKVQTSARTPEPAAPVRSNETLDAGWDRRIAGGKLVPDTIVDLHGLTVEAARAELHRRVHSAEAHGARIILVITGKGGKPGPSAADLMPGLGGNPADRRGAIRASLPRWLGEDSLSGRIAAVRRAHPRHGGAGAAYIILKRRR